MQVHFCSSQLGKGILLNDGIPLLNFFDFFHSNVRWLQLLLHLLLFLLWLSGGQLGCVLGFVALSILRCFISLALGSRQLTPLEAVHFYAIGLLLVEGHVNSQLFGRHLITHRICF